ncbi:MAG: hypothetical protein ACR2QH_15180 [Geminicoccaceae bacterium]
MHICEACGRQTDITFRSYLGVEPVCEPCFDHYAETPKQLALAVRGCRETRRRMHPFIKRRITCYAGEGVYEPLRNHYARLRRQQLVIVAEEDHQFEDIMGKQRNIRLQLDNEEASRRALRERRFPWYHRMMSIITAYI